jgi:uncharacterized protein
MTEAGEFSKWLVEIRSSLISDSIMDVPCGKCIGCCVSSKFVRVQAQETMSIKTIPEELLHKTEDGSYNISFQENGHCSMLVDEKCQIYDNRPKSCRQFDCRIYTAAGLLPNRPEEGNIVSRVKDWKFSYDSADSLDCHEAVKETANFIQQNGKHFPGGRTPSDPSQIALVAIKAYPALLQKSDNYEEIALRIVALNEEFEKQRTTF